MHLWATTKLRAPQSINNILVCGPWHVATMNNQIWIHFEFENLLILLIPSYVCMRFYHSFTMLITATLHCFWHLFDILIFAAKTWIWRQSSLQCKMHRLSLLSSLVPITHHSTNAYQSYWWVITIDDNSSCTAYQCPKCGNTDFQSTCALSVHMHTCYLRFQWMKQLRNVLMHT